MQESRIEYNELFLAIYLFMFIILRVFTTTFQQISTIILFLAVLILVGLSFIYNKGKFEKSFIVFLSISLIFWITQFLFYANDYTFYYLYYFIIYGVLSAYFLSYMKKFNSFLYYYSFISFISFFIMSIDPLLDFRFSATYMTFGFALLPVFCGLLIGYILFNKRLYGLLSFISFIQLLFFANRSAILTAGVFAISLMIYHSRKKNKNFLIQENIAKLIICVLILVTILIININPILSVLNNFLLNNFSYKSYSLVTLIEFTESWNFQDSYSSRAVIQEAAIKYFWNNNIFTGNGIGGFHSHYGRFSHNFIIDILNSTGIIGLFIFVAISFYSFRWIIGAELDIGVFYILMFCLTVIPLTFSSTFIETSEFWILSLFVLFNAKNVKYHIE